MIIRKVTLVGFWINALLVFLKLFFGYWGHSDALVADGYHSVSDFISDFIVLFFVSIAYKKADPDHPYGHGKYETIASVMIGLILLIVAIYIGIEGGITINKYIQGTTLPKPNIWTIVIAVLSIISKEYCFRYTIKYGNKLDSSVLIANAWHHRSDSLSSIATLVGVSASYFLGETWRILDPLAAILIAILIAIAALKLARPSINELLEAGLPEKQRSEILDIIKSVNGVKRAHNLRARRNGHSFIVDVNIHVDPDITVRAAHEIASGVEFKLHEKFGPDTIIYVHIEPELESHTAIE